MRGGRQTHRRKYIRLVLQQGHAILQQASDTMESNPAWPALALLVYLFLTSGLEPSFPVYTPASSSALPSELLLQWP